MTSEEIKAAIDRLQVLAETDIVTALTGEYGWTDNRARECLIDLLRQADPDAHVALPVDAGGVPIHIGDKVESVRREDGTVVGIEYCEDGSVRIAVRPYNRDVPTWWCNPEEYRHYHKPTVSEILDELEGLRGRGDYESVVMRAAELAGMLRELMADE